MQAEISVLLQSLPVLLAHHREAEAAPHATEDAQQSAADTAAHPVPLQEGPADGLNKSVISKLAQVWCFSTPPVHICKLSGGEPSCRVKHG